MEEPLQISTRDLAPDGCAVAPNQTSEARPASDDEARAVLEAFRALPAVALVDVDARVFLTGPGGQISVRNNHGRLSASRVPELTNTPVECSPDDIIVWVRSAPDTSAPAAATGTDLRPVATGGWRGRMSSRPLFAALLLIGAAVTYFNFEADDPEGIEYLADSAASAAAQGRLRGRYAAELAPGQTVLTIDDGRLRIATLTEDGREEEVADFSYRLGRRGEDGPLVLVANNGAVLDVRADGSVTFGETLYPRLVRAQP